MRNLGAISGWIDVFGAAISRIVRKAMSYGRRIRGQPAYLHSELATFARGDEFFRGMAATSPPRVKTTTRVRSRLASSSAPVKLRVQVHQRRRPREEDHGAIVGQLSMARFPARPSHVGSPRT